MRKKTPLGVPFRIANFNTAESVLTSAKGADQYSFSASSIATKSEKKTAQPRASKLVIVPSAFQDQHLYKRNEGLSSILPYEN